MNTKVRQLLIAVALSLLASAISIALLMIPRDEIPLFHHVTDLQLHFAALDHGSQIGLGEPPYDSTDAKTDKIVAIPIDEVSFASNNPELHQYPYPRSVYGTFLKKLKAAGAKVAAFDINFIELYVLVTALIIVVTNLCVDIIYAKLDPRIRY